MLGLGGKGPQAPAGASGIPTQRVLSLSSQGMSEPEIIRTLQREGYQPMAVDRAMKDAMRSGAGQAPHPPGMMAPPHAPMAPAPAPRMAPQPAFSGPAPYPRPMAPAPMASPGPQPFGGFEEPSFQKSKYAPTEWGDDDDLPDDDLDMKNVPKDQRLGPAGFFADLDEDKFPGPPDAPDRQPLRFAEAPLPKGGEERDRELKDRRRHEVEEMVEQIAEEKWQDMARRVHDVDERLEKLSSDVKNAPMRAAGGPAPEEVAALKNDLSSIRQSVEETNARIDSLEEVVKGSLSPMIESLRKLRGAPAGGPERLERPERYQQSQPSAMPRPQPQKPQASSMDESYEIPRYAPKRDEGE